MTQERPNPDVDVQFPDGVDLHRFSFILGGLASFAVDAMRHGDVPKAEAASDLQLALLAENPEAAVLVDEVFGDVIEVAGPDSVGIADTLEMGGHLEDVDVDEVRSRVDGTDGDMTDIEIE